MQKPISEYTKKRWYPSTSKGLSRLTPKFKRRSEFELESTPSKRRNLGTAEKPSSGRVGNFHPADSMSDPLVRSVKASKLRGNPRNESYGSVTPMGHQYPSALNPWIPFNQPEVAPTSSRNIGKVQDFNGLLEEDAKNWIEQFELVAEVNRWTDLAKCIQIYSCFKGRALKWYQTLPMEKKRDYNELRNSFMREFQTESRREDLYNQLRRRKQLAKESVGDYGREIERGILEIDPQMSEREKISLFLEGLDMTLKIAVLKKKAKTLPEAIEAAKDEELLEKQIQTYDRIHKVDQLEEIVHTVRRLEKELEKKQQMDRPKQFQHSEKRSYPPRNYPEGSKWTPEGKPICVNCHKPGHIARNCRFNRESFNKKYDPRESQRRSYHNQSKPYFNKKSSSYNEPER